MINPVSAAGNSYPARSVTGQNAVGAAPSDAKPGPLLVLSPPASLSARAPLVVMDPAMLEVFRTSQANAPPPDKSSPYWVDLTTSRSGDARAAPYEAAGIGWIPGDVALKGGAGLTSWFRERVSEARAAAQRELELSQQAGQEVRLGRDPATRQEIALTKDDARFAQIKGARAVFEDLPRDLGIMRQDLKDFADLLSL